MLAAEFAAAGRAAQYEQLKPWLAGEAPVARQTEAARQLGMNEGAVKVAIHRMRRRFREALRAETAQTLAVGDDVEAELRYLVEALTQN